MEPHSDKHTVGTIASRRQVAPDLFTMRVVPEELPEYRAGQYATLGTKHDGKLIERAYSIASAPHESELEFFIEIVPEGKLTPHLAALNVGDSLQIRKVCRGSFLLDRSSGHRHHVMVATVTGVAPFVSMVRSLRHAEAAGEPIDLHLYVLQGASRSWELTYSDELSSVAREAEWLQYIPTVSRPHEDTSWSGEQGRVHTNMMRHLERFSCNPDNTTAYLCGHPGMIEEAKETLIASGFNSASILEERYWVQR